MSVAGIFEFVDSEKQILVSTDAAGRVWLDARTVTVTNDDVTECASPAECTDTAYVLEPWRWTSSFHYYFNGGSTPSYLLKSDVSSDIFQATTNIISARNNCGRADYIDASYVYEGYTTRWANITGTPSCATPDGYSVTSFGTQPAGNLANTCTWYNSSGTASESDTVINNTGVSWFTGVTPAGCTTKYSINDVMTHERGHTYGLNHPGSCHANLTMYASEGPCTLRNTTLGLGDMLGLGVLY
ncbi:MAG: M66 family metalloprotease [Polyangiaceae bacterium]